MNKIKKKEDPKTPAAKASTLYQPSINVSVIVTRTCAKCAPISGRPKERVARKCEEKEEELIACDTLSFDAPQARVCVLNIACQMERPE